MSQAHCTGPRSCSTHTEVASLDVFQCEKNHKTERLGFICPSGALSECCKQFSMSPWLVLSQVAGPLLSSLLACPCDSPSWVRLEHQNARLTANSGNLQEQEVLEVLQGQDPMGGDGEICEVGAALLARCLKAASPFQSDGNRQLGAAHSNKQTNKTKQKPTQNLCCLLGEGGFSTHGATPCLSLWVIFAHSQTKFFFSSSDEVFWTIPAVGEGSGLFPSSDISFSSNPLHPEIPPGLAPPKPYGCPSQGAVSQLGRTILDTSMSTGTLPCRAAAVLVGQEIPRVSAVLQAGPGTWGLHECQAHESCRTLCWRSFYSKLRLLSRELAPRLRQETSEY